MTDQTRRNLLRTAGVAAAATIGTAITAGPAAAHARPQSRRKHGVTSFVFVTGANGSASAPSELAVLGHRVLGVDLPGHGPSEAQFSVAYQAPQDLERLATLPSPVAGKTLDDYAQAVSDVVRQVARHGPATRRSRTFNMASSAPAWAAPRSASWPTRSRT